MHSSFARMEDRIFDVTLAPCGLMNFSRSTTNESMSYPFGRAEMHFYLLSDTHKIFSRQ